MKSYIKKAKISGNVIEIFEYSEPVLYDYKDTKKKSKGRSVVASDEDKISNREQVLARARKEIRGIINCNWQPYSKFLTLTFADNIQDLDFANNEFKKFIKRMNYKYKMKLCYLAVSERQKRGAIHYHVCLFNLTQKCNIDEIESIWGHGAINFKVIDGSCDNVGAYLCKYLYKDSDECSLYGYRTYLTSRNIKRPEEQKDPALIAEIEKSLLQQSPKYENIFSNEHRSVVYKQYIIK